MSNELIDIEDNKKDLVNRSNDLADMTPASIPNKFHVKASIPQQPAPVTGAAPDPDVLVRTVSMQQEAFREKVSATSGNIKSGVATLDNLKLKTPTVIDYAHMTEDDVYNLDVPMEARPFSSEDSLRVTLRDSGLIARWVNKDARRLGAMIAKGFQYVTEKDLAKKLEVEVSADSEGHFSLGDVILMKITKDRYLPALRAAHLRAVNSVGAKGAHRSAVNNANEYMAKETGGAFKEEAEAQKVAFYTPGLSI